MLAIFKSVSSLMEIKWRMYFIFNSHMIFSRVAVIKQISSGLNYLEKLL